jgi:hypothetical protein
MSANPHIMFLDTSEIASTQNLERVIDVFPKLGFEIVQAKVRENVYDWNIHNQTQTLRNAEREKQLSLQCVNHKMKVDIGQDLNWDVDELGGKNRAWIRTYTFGAAYFWDSIITSEKYSNLLLAIGTDLYNILKPSFGWIDFNFGLQTTHEDIEIGNLPTLYWANFFGPRYVNVLGENKILNAPGWKIDRLSDNGYLYVLSSGLGLSYDTVSIETIKKYFGIDKVR